MFCFVSSCCFIWDKWNYHTWAVTPLLHLQKGELSCLHTDCVFGLCSWRTQLQLCIYPRTNKLWLQTNIDNLLLQHSRSSFRRRVVSYRENHEHNVAWEVSGLQIRFWYRFSFLQLDTRTDRTEQAGLLQSCHVCEAQMFHSEGREWQKSRRKEWEEQVIDR